MVGETTGWLGASLLAEHLGLGDSYAPPPVSLDDEKAHGSFIIDMVSKALISSAHDISDGGLIVAVTEMAMRAKMGASLTIAEDIAQLFGEDQARYVITTSDESALEAAAKQADVPVQKIGHVTAADETGHGVLKIGTATTISLQDVCEANEALLPQIASA